MSPVRFPPRAAGAHGPDHCFRPLTACVANSFSPPGSWLAVAAVILCLGSVTAGRAQSTPMGLDPDFAADPDDRVEAVALQPDGKVILGGFFGRVNGAVHNHIARLNGGDGRPDAGFSASANNYVNSVALQPDGKVVVGGGFSQVNGQVRSRVARLRGNGSLDTAFNASVNGEVTQVALQPDGRILLCGDFNEVNRQPCKRLARLNADGSLDAGFNAEANDTVRALAVQPDGKVVVVGEFSGVNNVVRNGVARLNVDGSLDVGFAPGPNYSSRSVAVQPDGRIILGGEFSRVNGVVHDGLVRLNADGSLDMGFAPSTDFSASSIAVQADGKIVLGGGFTAVNGKSRRHLARLNADGSLDTGLVNPVDTYADSAISANVKSVAVQGDGKIVLGGYFGQVNGVARTGIARVQPGSASLAPAPVVSVVGNPARGGFVVSRTGDLSQQLPIRYHTGGSAVRDVDYDHFADVNLLRGQAETVMFITLPPGANRNRKVKVFLDPTLDGSYTVGKVQSKVLLNDLR